MQELATLLVIESGAEWPTWSRSFGERASLNLVETEMVGETPEEFAARVLARLVRLRVKGVQLAAAGYAAAARSDRQASRKLILNELLRDLPRDAELVIAGGSWKTVGHGAENRAALFELWGALSERAQHRLISVRFNDEGSGLYPSASFTDHEQRTTSTSY